MICEPLISTTAAGVKSKPVGVAPATDSSEIALDVAGGRVIHHPAKYPVIAIEDRTAGKPVVESWPLVGKARINGPADW